MTGAIILAAGSSSRLGKPKQNLVFNGQTLLQRAIEAALSSACRPVIVVLGSNVESIRPSIESYPIQIVYNPDWNEGMASSIRAGLTRFQEVEPVADSVILMLCDQPFVFGAILNQLIELKSESTIIACVYNETTGVPALFDKFYFDELLLLSGPEGAKKLLLKYKDAVKAVPFDLGSIDIDTTGDFEKLTLL